jgi:hypothetical protein
MFDHMLGKLFIEFIAFPWGFTSSYGNDTSTSSACCKSFISVFKLLFVKPLKFSVALIFSDIISTTKRKIIAEMGHPFLIPLFIKHVFEIQPLFFI